MVMGRGVAQPPLLRPRHLRRLWRRQGCLPYPRQARRAGRRQGQHAGAVGGLAAAARLLHAALQHRLHARRGAALHAGADVRELDFGRVRLGRERLGALELPARLQRQGPVRGEDPLRRKDPALGRLDHAQVRFNSILIRFNSTLIRH